jgi:predicted lipid carrier protein YhbT
MDPYTERMSRSADSVKFRPSVLDRVRPLARKLAGLPGRLVPYAAQKPLLALALNEAFRQPLRQGDMDFLRGARLRVRVTDLSIDWLIRIDAERFTPIDRDGAEDVAISGESRDFLLLATRRADPDTLFFQRRIRIEGDTELGLGIKNTMDSMDWDDLPMPLRRLLQALGALIGKFS